MRISPHYIDQNRQLLEKEGGVQFGSSGHKWAADVEITAALLNTTSVLDYGCGRGSLAKALPGLPIREYDPCVRGKDAEPLPADIVVCTDVLEHIEPECIDAVLAHIQALGRNIVLLVIYVDGPASAVLPDGRNAHLIQEHCQWWTEKINTRWMITQMNYIPPHLFVLAKPAAEGIKK